MIENALYPRSTHGTVGAIRQDCGVLDWNTDLIVEAIRDPAANLRRRRRTGIHQHIEGMVDVVGTALGPQLRLEFFPAPGGKRS